VSLESDLYGVLSALCPRVYPDFAPTTEARPYLTWQIIGGSVIAPVSNDMPDKRNAMVQVNVWADTRAQANTMAQQIEEALMGSALFQARPIDALSAAFDDDLSVRGAQQTFSIWASR